MEARKIATFWFVMLVIVDLIFLGFMSSEISISHREALAFFSQDSFAGFIAHVSTQWFGQNDIALRAPFLLAHLINLTLIFKICNHYLKKPFDSLLCALIFALLPGINVIALLVSKSVFVLLFALLLCYLHIKKYNVIFFPLCLLSSFLDYSFSIVLLALLFYAFRHKHNKTFFFSLLCFGVNMYFFTPQIHGIPSGYFLDTIGLLALLYSPLLFIYYVYTLYYRINKKEHTLPLYIGATSILFTLLLSLRQEIDLHTFLPLSVVGLPVMIKVFMHDMRIRLKNFRHAYIRRFYILLVPLLLEFSLLAGNKVIFLFDKSHFLDNVYYAKEIANELKSRNIYAVSTNSRLQTQLLFYGIKNSPTIQLYPQKGGEIKVNYVGVNVREYALKTYTSPQ